MAIGKINKVKVDLRSYPPYMLLAPKKFGKTTFWNDLVIKAWGSAEKGLLISCGNEEGYHALDGMQVVVAKTFTGDYEEDSAEGGLTGIVDYIVDHNDELGLCGVCFDTLDTLVDIATDEVLRQHKKEKGTVCKTLNEAFSGYGRGKDRLKKICNEQINKLREAGVAVFFLCHTKLKEQTDMASGEKYEQITNNLTDDIFSNFADAAQMVMVGTFDREINSGKLLSESRVVYLRGNSFVNAGGRFTNLKDKISGEREEVVDEFLSAFEEAVKSSITSSKDVSKAITKAKKEEEEKRKEVAQAAKEANAKDKKIDEDRNNELKASIQAKHGKLDSDHKTMFKDLLAENKVTSLKEVADIPTKVLEDIDATMASWLEEKE